MQEGRIHWLRAEALPWVDVMDVHGVSRRWSHHHETYTFCVSKPDGRCPGAEWLYRGRVHEMRAGGTMLMEPGEFHCNSRPTPVADFYVVLIEPEEFGRLVRAVQGDTKLDPALQAPQLYVPDIEQKARELILHLRRGEIPSTQEALLGLVNLLYVHDVFEQKLRAPAFAGARAVRRAVELIQDAWDQPVQVTDLVREIGVPASTLSHAFRRKVGMGLRQYRKRVRLERSRQLLLKGNDAVADLAASCGFYDVSTYCREFKGLFGITPSEYRRLGACAR